jgi:ABC-type glycerol-3-phosphate transport system substrate-binding protein
MTGQRSVRRKVTFLAALLSGGTLALTGCIGADSTNTGGSDSGSGGDEFSGNLKVQVYGDWPFVKRNAESFMQLHPDAKIEVGGITNDDLRQSGGRLFTSADSPDVVSYTLQPSLMEDWISAGALTPLDDVWQKDGIETTVSKTTTEISTASDGKKYSIPLGLTQTPYLFYNKDAWAKAGATPPDPKTHQFASLEQFNSNMKKLKDSGQVPLSIPGSFIEYMFNAPFASSCGAQLYQQIATNWKPGGESAPKYTEPCAVKAVQQLADWSKAGYFAPGLQSLTFEQSQTLFDTQKAGSWIMGSWVPPVYEPKDFKWDWAFLPSLGTDQPAHGVGVDAFLVPSGAKNQPLAKSFISYMISKEVIEDGMGRIPARNDVDLSKVIESEVEISLAESAKDGEQIPYWSTTATVSQEQAFLQSVVAGAMAGSKTVQEAVEQLQKAADDYRSQHQ